MSAIHVNKYDFSKAVHLITRRSNDWDEIKSVTGIAWLEYSYYTLLAAYY